MTAFYTLISFAALCSVGLFIKAITKCKAAFAPLASLCFTMLYFVFFGAVNMLLVGGYLYFLLAIAIVVYFIAKKTPSAFFKEFLTPGIYFFVLSAFAMVAVFFVKQPLLTAWDDFSFWGTAAKLVSINNELYTTATIGWPWAATQKPGLIMLSYFFNFFGEYGEWRLLFAYNLLFIAIFSAVMEPLKGKWRSLAFPASLLLFFTPFVFIQYSWSDVPSLVYLTALADTPMGLLFGACLVFWFGEHQNMGAKIGLSLISLAALVYVKDTAFPLAMIAAGIMAADCLISCIKTKKICKSLATAASLLSVPVATFLSWSFYLSRALNVNSFEIGGQDNKNMFEFLVSGISELFGFGTTEKFSAIMGKMWDNIFSVKISFLGCGAVLICLFIAIFLICILCEKDKLTRARIVSSGVLMFLGFIAFYIFTGFTFVYVFKPIEAESLSSYIRYIYPYYIGWFVFALHLLFKQCLNNKAINVILARGSLFALTAVFTLSFFIVSSTKTSVIDYYDDFLIERRTSMSKAKQVQDIVKDRNAKIFFISQMDNGIRWFTYSNELLPFQLDYSFGGGTFAAPGALPEGAKYYIPLTKDEFLDYILENNCKYIFVERSNSYLSNEFGSLFSDYLTQCNLGNSAVYEVLPDENRFELKTLLR